MLARDLEAVQELVSDLRAVGRTETARALAAVLAIVDEHLGEGQPRRGGTREYLTTGQAASALGVSRQTIKNWVQAGRLRGVQLGGRTVVQRGEVEALLNQLLAGGSVVQRESRTDLTTARAGYEAMERELPPRALARLQELHARVEEGARLTAAESRDMVRLEREVNQAATRALAPDAVSHSRAG